MSTSVCPFNEDLIKLVQKNPILYDCNLQAYKNDALKFGTWKSIAEQLDEDGKSILKSVVFNFCAD